MDKQNCDTPICTSLILGQDTASVNQNATLLFKRKKLQIPCFCFPGKEDKNSNIALSLVRREEIENFIFNLFSHLAVFLVLMISDLHEDKEIATKQDSRLRA